MSTLFESRLYEAARQLDLQLEHEQVQFLLAYLQQLERWNRTYNLTAVRDPEQMLIQHIFDSLAVVPAVYHILDKKPVSECIIIDVGSGGGLPGIVLAIAGGWTVHCVDAVEKKAAFLRQMSASLKLPNLHAHHARIEQLDPFGADIVISRAFSSLKDFVDLAGHHASRTGVLLAMKGRTPHDEIRALEADSDWVVTQQTRLTVPELEAQRCVLHLSRQGQV